MMACVERHPKFRYFGDQGLPWAGEYKGRIGQLYTFHLLRCVDQILGLHQR